MKEVPVSDGPGAVHVMEKETEVAVSVSVGWWVALPETLGVRV